MISIIIPTRNEEDSLGDLLTYLSIHAPHEEIIVVDGGSTDNTRQVVKDHKVKLVEASQGRAHQMNEGAKIAKGDLLYFLHADTYPPKDFVQSITSAATQGYGFGWFKIKILPSHFWIRFFEFIGSIKSLYFVFGDRSLFVKKKYFKSVGGFREDHIVMEDQEILFRLKKITNYIFLPEIIKASNRKYIENGVFRLELIYTILFFMYYLGFSQQTIIKMYKKLIISKQYD